MGDFRFCCRTAIDRVWFYCLNAKGSEGEDFVVEPS